MRIDVQNGHPTIKALDLADMPGLPPDELRERMRDGRITSRPEAGEGEDAGKMRLNFFHDGTRARLTFSKDGTVLKTLRTKTGAR